MQNIFKLEESLDIPRDSYVLSYPHLVEFFENKETFSEDDVVCGAHMVYGWMPTILELHSDPGVMDVPKAAQLLTKAKTNGSLLTEEQLGKLASLVNKSVVGASKLLHFVSPAKFAMWDSKVYSFVHEECPYHYRVNNAEKYSKYLDLLAELSRDDRFPGFHSSVNRKLGYEVTPFRALELVMFRGAQQ